MRNSTIRSSGLKAAWIILLTAALAACGSSDNTLYNPDGSGTSTDGGQSSDAVAKQVASLVIIPSANELRANADGVNAQGISLAVLALDDQNNVLAGAPVTVSSDSGIIQSGSSAKAQVFLTDSQGRARFTLTTGGNSSLRDITVTATSGGATAQLVIPVIAATTGGTSGVASLLAFPDKSKLPADADDPQLLASEEGGLYSVVVTVVALSEGRNVVPNVPVELTASSGILLPAELTFTSTQNSGVGQVVSGFTPQEQLITDATGRATAILTTGGDPTERTITITATVGDITQQFTVDVVEPTAAGGDEASGVANVDLVSSSQTLASASDLVGEGVALGALVSNANGVLLPGIRVNFAVASGGGALLVLNDGLTDSTGAAGAILTTGGNATPRTITVQATVTNLAGSVIASDTLQIQVVGGQSASNVNLYANAAQMPGSPDGQITLTVVAVDSTNNVLPELPVTFTATSGAITPQNTQSGGAVVTNSLGIATAILTPGGNFTPRSITVTAIVGSEGNQVSRQLTVSVINPDTPVDLPDVNSVTVLTSAAELPVGGGSTDSIDVTAIALGSDGLAVEGVPIRFSVNSNSGTLISTNQSQTNASGQATATLTATAQALAGNTVTVTAVAETGDATVSGSTTISLIPNVASIDLSTAVDRISATGTSTSLITASARGPNGALLSGVDIQFSASSGSLSAASDTTDSSGSATTTLGLGGDNTARVITVTATEPSGTSASVQVAVGAAVNSVTVNSDVDSLEEGDQSTVAAITVVVLDNQNRPVQGEQVTFTASNGGFIQVSNDVTNAGGNASATLSVGSAASGSAIVVTAAAGGDFGTATIVVTARQVPEPPVAASVRLLASSPQLRTGDDDVNNGIEISAIVRDSDGVLIPDISVSFANTEIDSDATNGVCLADSTPGTSAGALQVLDSVTDSTGTARAILTAGGDKRNRCLRVTATVGSGVTPATLFVPVTGSSISISGPSTVATDADATYTVTLTDGGGNGVGGETVTVSTANGNLLRNINSDAADGAATVNVVTDTSGVARFIMQGTVGDADPNDPDTRESLQVTALELSATQRVSVASVSMLVEADSTDPDCDTDTSSALSEIALGSGCTVNVTLVDTVNSAVGRPITLASTRGSAVGTVSGNATETTVDDGNGNGVASFVVTAPTSAGAGLAILEATADNGATETLTIEFVATVPNSVDVQAEPGIVPVNGSSVIRAVVRDVNNNLVKNQTVLFSLNDVSSGSLSSASQVTNSQGVAQVTFNASGTSSASNGVEITASVANSAVNGMVTLTVSGRALRITLGTGNELQDDITVYRVPYAVIVTDAEGNPPPTETVFRLAVLSTRYFKGTYVSDGSNWVVGTCDTVTNAPVADADATCIDEFGTNGEFIGGYIAECAQEDDNRNGILDAGEDDNSDGALTPGNVATVPTTVELTDGVGEFDVVYPQEFGNWIEVQLRAVATVAGTETVETQTFILPISANDAKVANGTPPGGLESVYGSSNSCLDTN